MVSKSWDGKSMHRFRDGPLSVLFHTKSGALLFSNKKGHYFNYQRTKNKYKKIHSKKNIISWTHTLYVLCNFFFHMFFNIHYMQYFLCWNDNFVSAYFFCMYLISWPKCMCLVFFFFTTLDRWVSTQDMNSTSTPVWRRYIKSNETVTRRLFFKNTADSPYVTQIMSMCNAKSWLWKKRLKIGK